MRVKNALFFILGILLEFEAFVEACIIFVTISFVKSAVFVTDTIFFFRRKKSLSLKSHRLLVIFTLPILLGLIAPLSLLDLNINIKWMDELKNLVISIIFLFTIPLSLLVPVGLYFYSQVFISLSTYSYAEKKHFEFSLYSNSKCRIPDDMKRYFLTSSILKFPFSPEQIIFNTEIMTELAYFLPPDERVYILNLVTFYKSKNQQRDKTKALKKLINALPKIIANYITLIKIYRFIKYLKKKYYCSEYAYPLFIDCLE